MRILPVLLAFSPLPLWAEDFVIATPVTRAALYLDGALVTRDSTLSIPAGKHRIILPDLPTGAEPASVSLRLGDRVVTAITFSDASWSPDEVTGDDPAITEAEDRVQKALAALADFEDRVGTVRARVEAAEALIAYLGRVGTGDGGVDDAEDLRAMAQVIASEILAARREAISAEGEARVLAYDREGLVDALKVAKQVLEALRQKSTTGTVAIADFNLSEAFDGPISASYIVREAQWQPAYDIHLARGNQPSLAMDRGAQVIQNSGENWHDVTLTLSTLHLFRPLQSDPPLPKRMRVDDSAPAELNRGLIGLTSVGATALVPAAENVATQLNGLGFVYTASGTHDVDSDVELSRLDLGTVDLKLDRMLAQTSALTDMTAFLVAEVTNGDEVILPSFDVRYFVDGLLIGTGDMPQIAGGDQLTLGFGPIDGLQVSRRISDRKEGDRGVITKSNEQTENVVISVKNLTDLPWELRVIDRVPYSEQEDLNIEYTSKPEPTETNFRDKRGILAWEREIAAGETVTITLNTRITFPYGKFLR